MWELVSIEIIVRQLRCLSSGCSNGDECFPWPTQNDFSYSENDFSYIFPAVTEVVFSTWCLEI